MKIQNSNWNVKYNVVPGGAIIVKKPKTHVSPSRIDMVTAFCRRTDKTDLFYFVADPPIPDFSRLRIISANTTRLCTSTRPIGSNNP